MVKVGDLYWAAEVRGVAEAQEQASTLEDSHDSAKSTFVETAEAQNELTQNTQEDTDAKQTNERWTERLNTDTGLLSSALTFLTGRFGVAAAAATVYSGALTLAAGATTLATGAVSLLSAVILGPAGLVAGVFLALAAVGLLGAELLGITNVTPIVAAETNSMAGLFADLAFLIGGPFLGVILMAYEILTGDFATAKDLWVRIADEWLKASARFAARVLTGFAAFGSAVVTGIRASIEAADFAWRAGLNKMIRSLNGFVEFTHDALVGGLNETVQMVIGGLNDLIGAMNRLPHVDIEPLSGDFRVGATEGRQTGRIGTIQNQPLRTRLRRVSRQENRRLMAFAEGMATRMEREFAPEPLFQGETQISTDQFGGERRDRTLRQARRARRRFRARAQRAADVQEQNISVKIGDQSLDLSNLSRSNLRRLAQLVGQELGTSTQNLAGSR